MESSEQGLERDEVEGVDDIVICPLASHGSQYHSGGDIPRPLSEDVDPPESPDVDPAMPLVVGGRARHRGDHGDIVAPFCEPRRDPIRESLRATEGWPELVGDEEDLQFANPAPGLRLTPAVTVAAARHPTGRGLPEQECGCNPLLLFDMPWVLLAGLSLNA